MRYKFSTVPQMVRRPSEIVTSGSAFWARGVAGIKFIARERTKTMTVLAKWDPMRELEEFSSRLAPFFGSSQLQNKEDRDETAWFTKAQWAPLVDISEDDQEYTIKAELPGLEKDQVRVTVENGTLLIAGERVSENEEKNRKYHRVERAHGSFLRSFALPDDADGTSIRAEFKNGVLKVHLPKAEAAKPKRIEIKVS
jgi:HSP20 family protein